MLHDGAVSDIRCAHSATITALHRTQMSDTGQMGLRNNRGEDAERREDSHR